MKQIITALAILISLQSIGQMTYDASVSFPMSDTTDEAGTVYKRKGFFIGMDYSQRGNGGVDIKVQVKLLNNTTELKKFSKSFNARFTVNNNLFVVVATGLLVGDRAAMRAAYGVIQKAATDSTPVVWRQSVVPGYGDSTTQPIMGQYTYLTKLFDENQKLHLIIKALCVAAVTDGRLIEE